MTDYPYEPPKREFFDTLLTFKEWQLASTWAVRVEPDPLGPINHIVTLMRGQQRIKSVLCRVPVGAAVRLVRDDGACWTARDIQALQHQHWDTRGHGEPAPRIDIRPPGWRIEIDGRTVLAVTDAEMQPPAQPEPRIPLWRRMRTTLTTQAHSDLDTIAKRLGYHRDEDCRGWDQ